MDKATKRPWKMVYHDRVCSFDGSPIAQVGGSTDWDKIFANAALIVKAVNLHDELVEALFRIEQVSNSVESLDAPEGTLLLIVDIAQEMLAKAKEIP